MRAAPNKGDARAVRVAKWRRPSSARRVRLQVSQQPSSMASEEKSAGNTNAVATEKAAGDDIEIQKLNQEYEEFTLRKERQAVMKASKYGSVPLVRVGCGVVWCGGFALSTHRLVCAFYSARYRLFHGSFAPYNAGGERALSQRLHGASTEPVFSARRQQDRPPDRRHFPLRNGHDQLFRVQRQANLDSQS